MMTLVDPCRSIRGLWGNGPGSSISVAIICIKVPSLRTLVNILSCKMVTLEREAGKRGIDNLRRLDRHEALLPGVFVLAYNWSPLFEERKNE